jgi:hypothetical protein
VVWNGVHSASCVQLRSYLKEKKKGSGLEKRYYGRHVDHVTPSIHKSCTNVADKRQSLGLHSSLADSSHRVFLTSTGCAFCHLCKPTISENTMKKEFFQMFIFACFSFFITLYRHKSRAWVTRWRVKMSDPKTWEMRYGSPRSRSRRFTLWPQQKYDFFSSRLLFCWVSQCFAHGNVGGESIWR